MTMVSPFVGYFPNGSGQRKSPDLICLNITVILALLFMWEC